MFDSTIERPRHHLQRTAIELTQEFRIFVITQPDKEITGCTITVHIVPAFRTGIRSVKSSIGNPHSICHSLDKCPEHTIGSIRTDSLRFQLISMCQFMQQYPACFEKQLCRIIRCKRFFNMTCTVENRHITIATAFSRNTVDIFQSIMYLVHCGNTIFRRIVKSS